MSGKGDKRRPQLISDDEMARNWELVFGKKKAPGKGAKSKGAQNRERPKPV